MAKKQVLNITEIQKIIANFASERDWDQFHNPKNLAMALSVEANELVEIFQWLTSEEASELSKSAPDSKSRIKFEDEIADVFVYLLRMADKLNVDIEPAIHRKMKQNGEKYTLEKSRGNAKKYTEFDE